MRKISPAARSVEPEIGLNRATITTSASGFGSSMMAGKSASPVWHSALGGVGASPSARTAQVPLNACAPAGGAPTGSASKVHLPEAVNDAVAMGGALVTAGDWAGFAQPTANSVI